MKMLTPGTMMPDLHHHSIEMTVVMVKHGVSLNAWACSEKAAGRIEIRQRLVEPHPGAFPVLFDRCAADFVAKWKKRRPAMKIFPTSFRRRTFGCKNLGNFRS